MSDDLWLSLPRVAATPKKDRPEPRPQEPMRAQIKGPRRNPSTDQKKQRRQLKRRPAKTAATPAALYHGSNVVLSPGDTLRPAALSGNRNFGDEYSWYDPYVVYLSTQPHLAERYALGAVRKNGGEPHVYLVRPIGSCYPDPESESGFGTDQWCATMGEIVKEIPLPGVTHLEDGKMMRGPAKSAALQSEKVIEIDGKPITLEWNGYRQVKANYGSTLVGILTWWEDQHTGSGYEILGIEVDRRWQRKGLATAMLQYGREASGHEIHHAPALTDDGKEFARAVARVGALKTTWTEPGEVGNKTHITMEENGTVPLAVIAGLRGVMGEEPGAHRNKQGEVWEKFKADIAANGITHPIFITVDYADLPRISEGNHRRDAAVELGLTEVPVQIRYFGHAEREGTVMERMSKTAIHFDADDWSCENATLDDGTVVHFYPYGDAVPGGYNGGWLAMVDGREVGHIDYQSGGGEVGIGMVEVEPEWRRRGVASALLGRLRREFPGKEIDPGMTTPEGSAWWSKAGSEEYQTGHQPGDDGPSLDYMDDPDSYYPPDVYEHPEYYAPRGPSYSDESIAVMRRVRGKPNAMVTIYRAAPSGQTTINTGDWVAITPSYARLHRESNGRPDWVIYSASVPARSIRNGGNDLVEWGYFGSPVQAHTARTANWMDDNAITVFDSSRDAWAELKPGLWLRKDDSAMRIVGERDKVENQALYRELFGDAAFGWQVSIPVGFGPHSGAVISGTAVSMEAAQAKAMAVTKKDDEANEEYREKQRAKFPELYPKAASLRTDIELLRPQLSAAVQHIVDQWDQDAEGFDEEFGYGGACDQAADAMASILGDHGIETASGGAEGDDHAWVVALRGEEVVGVDIPPGVYETGGGYSWTKRQDVSISPRDVEVWEIDVPAENFREAAKTAFTYPEGIKFSLAGGSGVHVLLATLDGEPAGEVSFTVNAEQMGDYWSDQPGFYIESLIATQRGRGVGKALMHKLYEMGPANFGRTLPIYHVNPSATAKRMIKGLPSEWNKVVVIEWGQPGNPVTIDGKAAAKTATRVYRGISLQGFEPGGFAMGLDSSIMGRFQTLMRKGDHQGAARLVLGLVGKSGGFVEGGGSGVWYSTDIEVARGYSGMHMRWQNPASGRAGEGTLACVIHAEVDDDDIDAEGASRGYTYEYPVVLKPGAQVDVVAIDLRYNERPMNPTSDGAWVHVPLNMAVTAAKTLDQAIEDLADAILNAPPSSDPGPSIWGERKPRVDPDWATVLSKIKTMYRGYGLRVSDDVYEMLFGQNLWSSHDKAAKVLELVGQRGLGTHWTTHRGEAAGFAGMTADKGDVRVIVEAHPPNPSDVLVGEMTKGMGIQAWDDTYGEQEIPIRSGAPIRVKGVWWAPGGPRPLARADDGGGWAVGDVNAIKVATVHMGAKFEPGQMASWPSTKPWNLSRADAEAQLVPGWWGKEQRGTESASWEKGYIRPSPEFYGHPESARRAIAYHEAGHAMVQAAGGLAALDDPLSIVDLPGATTLGYNAEEVLAEGYSVLWTEPSWLDQYKAVRDLVIGIAKRAGFPLPGKRDI